MRAEPNTPGTADRLEFVDSLRGFALFGVFGANLFIFSGLAYMSDAQKAALPTAALDRIVQLVELIFVETKFMGLFAFLFGVSFWLFLSRAQARGPGGVALFYRRIGWLFVIGAIHGWLFWCWDILRFYALWGLVLPLFLNVSQKTVLRSGLFCAVLAPALITGLRKLLLPSHPSGGEMDALALQAFSSGGYRDMLRANWLYDWFLTLSVGQIAYQIAIPGRLLLGLYAARAGLLSRLEEHQPLLRKILLWGLLIGIPANCVIARGDLDAFAATGFVGPFARRFNEELGYLALSLAYAAGLALLFLRPWGARYVRRLAPAGRMALSCYLGQTLLGLWLFYGFLPGPHGMGRIGPAGLVPIWLFGYAIQIALASAWLRRFRFGPAEWLWRSLTYGRIQPFRVVAPALKPSS